jgi:muramoyltetrapeptide carboxypeptidase
MPDRLRPGDTVRVIAPASPFDPRLVWRALGWLSERYRVLFSRRIFDHHGYLAGDDRARRDELWAGLNEPGVGALIAARGGYGISRIAHEIDWTVLRRLPRWIVGFSDVTALHIEAARQAVASIHGVNATALGRSDAHSRAALVDLLERPLRRRVWTALDVLHRGHATGPMFGGNLSLLHACAAAGRLAPAPGSIWLIEDVGERPYRLDRLVTTLRVGGHLDSAAAVVLGEFEGCHPGPDGTALGTMLQEQLAPLGVPVVANAPVGHGLRNEPVVLGAPATLDATGDSGTLVMGS